jgi:hypothetical protein
MLMIARLYPRTNLDRIWAFVENEVRATPSRSLTPLYATQTEGMMNVGIIFEAEDPEDIATFLTEEIPRCDEVHHTRTVSLVKPVFFAVPRERPQTARRYLLRLFAHPRYYKQTYEHLVGLSYSTNLFPIYVSYSLGDEDILMNLGADSEETVRSFIKEHVRVLDGVDQVTLHPVCRAKRFAALDTLLQQQKKYLGRRPSRPTDQRFDWVEDFEQFAMLSGALPGDV